MRDGRARVCVATDVAARGIDLPGLALVIHADLPHDVEVMQHRSGRTGRAGRKGTSVLLVPPARRRRAESMMAEARIEPIWSSAPSAEEIRRLDQERMAADPLLAEEPGEEDLVMARALMEQKSPEEIAAALVRVYRARLPAPEDVSDPGHAPPARRARTDVEPHHRPAHEGARGGEAQDRASGGSWFRLNIGRRNNADPRWLLPMLCRRGNVTKDDIGAIRIFDRETKIEIRGAAAGRFAESVRRGQNVDPRIEPSAEAPRPRMAHDGPTPSADAGRRRRATTALRDRAAEPPDNRPERTPA